MFPRNKKTKNWARFSRRVRLLILATVTPGAGPPAAMVTDAQSTRVLVPGRTSECRDSFPRTERRLTIDDASQCADTEHSEAPSQNGLRVSPAAPGLRLAGGPGGGIC